MDSRLKKNGACLIIMQALRDALDDPEITPAFKSKTAQNFLTRLIEFLEKSVGKLFYNSTDEAYAASDQLVFASQIVWDFACMMQDIPEENCPAFDRELEALFEKYQNVPRGT